jgi:hypothetical protein
MRGGGTADGGGTLGVAGRAAMVGACGADGTVRSGVAVGAAELAGGRGGAIAGTVGLGAIGVTGAAD